MDGEIVSDPQIIAENIALHFESVSADQNFSDTFLENRHNNFMDLDFSTDVDHTYNDEFTIGELLYVLGKVRGMLGNMCN